jgi:acyl-CoA synthetase (AMP-forming)/AMP-acid ligase II
MNLSLLLEMAAGGFGDRVVYQSGTPDDGSVPLTAGELHERARRIAHDLVAERRSAVVYLAPNSAAFPIALFAAAWAGIPMVPLNYRLSTEQLQRQLSHHPGSLMVIDPRISVPTGDAHRISPAELLESSAAATESDLAAAPMPDQDPDGIALLLYTSGTSSEPKAAILRHRHLSTYVTTTVEYGAADPGDASLVSVPPYHIAGVSNTLTNLYGGRRVIHIADFTPDMWLHTVRSESVTHALVVPTMLARIVDHIGATGAATARTPSLRTLSYGGAPMPSDVVERALRLFPGVDFVNAYGLTETSSTIALLGPQDHRDALASTDPLVRARLGSAGRILPEIEAQIRDESGTPVPAGSVGTLWVRGPQVSGEYRDHDGNRDPEGWFHTRDRAYLDAEDYLYIVGRADDTIIRGGENIAPAEVEEALRTHDRVLDAAVVGIPDREWGHRIAAAVVIAPEHRDTTSPEQLRAHVRERLRSSKTPDQIVFVTELPYSDMGKLSRRSVAELVLAGSTSSTQE